MVNMNIVKSGFLCKFIGHLRDIEFTLSDDSKYVILDNSVCLRCGKPNDEEPHVFPIKRSQKKINFNYFISKT